MKRLHLVVALKVELRARRVCLCTFVWSVFVWYTKRGETRRKGTRVGELIEASTLLLLLLVVAVGVGVVSAKLRFVANIEPAALFAINTAANLMIHLIMLELFNATTMSEHKRTANLKPITRIELVLCYVGATPIQMLLSPTKLSNQTMKRASTTSRFHRWQPTSCYALWDW